MEPIKERITAYWTGRAEAFQAQRMRELSDVKHERWLTEFHRYLPQGRQLDILDLGTGTGFFALLLAAQGHRTVGIDLTEEMITRAMASAAQLELAAEFHVMDAENPAFPEGSFDALVTRNLTWTLPHLSSAYKRWYKLLRPGGVLVNFDADYCRRVTEGDDPELPPNHAHKTLSKDTLAESDAIAMELSAYQNLRPEWDLELLLNAGFERVTVDTGVWKRVYAEKDEFYNPTPIFTIAAWKQADQPSADG